MVVSDLMIGNAVQYNGSQFKVADISSAWPRVNERYNNKPVVTLFDGGIFTACIDEISPIPITEEWLAKNDFKEEYSHIVYCHSHKRKIGGYYVDIQYGCSNMGDEYVNCHIDSCDRCTVASVDIHYVHQLQNLLNIMNIKFDIVL